MLYINGFVSMSSTNLWNFFQIYFWFMYLPKTYKFSYKYWCVHIDQSAMCNVSIDLSQQGLQTNGKLFFFQIFKSFLN